MKIQRKDLYDVIGENLSGDYSIGMHGINEGRLNDFYPGLTREEAVRRITREGLTVFSARTINGTVRTFGRFDLDKEKVQRELERYYYPARTYIIVAIPSIFRTESGKEIFVGTSNVESKYKNFFSTTGNESTTLLDECILDRSGWDSKIDPRFILGTITELEDGYVEYKENPNHISKTGGKVSEELYERAEREGRFLFSPDEENISVLTNYKVVDENKIWELIDKYEDELYSSRDSYSYVAAKEATILETLRQLLREKNRIKQVINDEEVRIRRQKQSEAFFLSRYRTFLTDSYSTEYYLNDLNFILDAFEYLDEDELKDFIKRYSNKFNEDIFNNRKSLIKMIEIDPKLLLKSKLRNNLDVMLEISSIKDIPLDILYYAGEDVLNNEEFIISILLNTNDITKIVAQIQNKYPESDFAFRDVIGIDIHNNKMFWSLLNGILRTKPNNTKLFDIDKELEISKQQKQDLESRYNVEVDLTNEDFFTYGKQIQVKFNYENEEQRAYIEKAFEEDFLIEYGYEKRKGKGQIAAYLVDEFGNRSNKFTGKKIVGGAAIPDDLLEEILRKLLEKYHCIIKCNDLVIKDTIDKSTLNQIIEELNKSTQK